MVEHRKYGSLMADIQKEQQAKPDAPSIQIPIKPAPPAGKRRDAAYKQKGVYLKEETVALATERLKRRGDKTDFSDLVQHLLEIWLSSP